MMVGEAKNDTFIATILQMSGVVLSPLGEESESIISLYSVFHIDTSFANNIGVNMNKREEAKGLISEPPHNFIRALWR
jgi:hypothetical protein